jgi:hypothetical protein
VPECVPEPPTLEPAAPVLAPGDVESLVVDPDAEGELMPVPLEPTAPPLPLVDKPGELGLAVPMDPDVPAPEPDRPGDAAGDWLSAIPATCIAC